MKMASTASLPLARDIEKFKGEEGDEDQKNPTTPRNIPFIAANPNLNNTKLFPALVVNRPDHVEGEDEFFQEKSDDPLPLIPPKGMAEEISIPPDPETQPNWFAILSPREKGAMRYTAGPYSVPEMKDLYRQGVVKDGTLVWHEGDKNWQQVLFQRYLRPKLLQMPIVPEAFLYTAPEEKDEDPYAVKFEGFKKSTFDPIVAIPSAEQIKSIVALKEFDVGHACSRCGSFSAVFMKGIGEQIPDLAALRVESKISTQIATEILPGFLWIGNQGSSKTNHLHHLQITLAINCTNNVAGPNPQPPVFRCKNIPLKEKPKSEVPKLLDNLLDLYSKAFDYIELERLHNERNEKTDVPPRRYTGPTDKYGRPIISKEDRMKNVVRANPNPKGLPPSRVLLWSRLGLDRACAIAIAYLIRRFSITLDRAFNIVETGRPGMDISPAYMFALKEWSARYTVGDKLCQDCIQGVIDGNSGKKEKWTEENNGIYNALKEQMKEEAQVVGDPLMFMPKIHMAFHISSPWSGMLDIILPGRRLGDTIIIKLFTALMKLGLSKRIRSCDIKYNSFGYEGIGAVCDAFLTGDDCSDSEDGFQLQHLDVSHNLINDDGGKYIAYFLKGCQTIISIDISHNEIGDEGCAAIFLAVSKPVAELFEVDDGTGAVPYNKSLTDLRMADTGMGHEAAETLVEFVKRNYILERLDIGMNPYLSAKNWKHLLNALRVYNSTIKFFGISQMPLTVKTVNLIARTAEGRCGMSTYDFSKCDLTGTHLKEFPKYFASFKHLMKLDLSSNQIGDDGAELLSTVIRGKVTKLGAHYPPIKYIELNSCKLSPTGCRSILEAIGTRNSIRYIDMSHNNIGCKIVEYFETSLMKCEAETIKFNGCQLQSLGAVAILDGLRSRTPLGRSLKVLQMSENDIQDTAASHIYALLELNNVIEVIDLGFNKFSQAVQPIFEAAIGVKMDAAMDRKLLDLHINMHGTPGLNDYALGLPNRARSKNQFTYAVNPSQGFLEDGFAHIPLAARPHFLAKKEHKDDYELIKPGTIKRSIA